MHCQKCRQPLKLDSSLDDLNPAAYDLLVSATSSSQTATKASTPRPSVLHAQEQSRKSLYDKVSQNAGTPTFKRYRGGQPRDATMSFIYLTESQVGHPLPPQQQQKERAIIPLADEVNRLFEILSARSDIDHPVCVDCTELLVEGLQKKLDSASKERDAYVQHLKDVQSSQPSEEDVKAWKEALKKAEKDKTGAMQELKRLEAEKNALDEEIWALEEESRQLDKEEENFWRERNAFAAKMADFQAERDSINAKYNNDSQLLEKLQRSNVYNDTFCISHDGSFATINGLRLGRLSNKPVDWPEVNAAWGHALLLLVTVADKLGYKFQGYEPVPLGSTSKIIRSGDMPLGLTFMHRKFDTAMVGFLELVRQLGVFVQQQTESTGVPLTLPYKIEGDKIGDTSIKLGIAQDDGWTKACKLTLTCCKFLLAHASNVTSNARNGA
ncbi:Vacuolar protein-sorting-associated protein 30 [Trichoderma virens FT-333]|nr:Vacuolar protein-sorting-associated protein 30 [Trichoderma virens FT-333]